MAAPKTRTTNSGGLKQLKDPTDAEQGSAAQRERRRRILDATLALASKGGYDAVQMRTVAEKTSRSARCTGTSRRRSTCWCRRSRGSSSARWRSSTG
jgi:hypothetical protein